MPESELVSLAATCAVCEPELSFGLSWLPDAFDRVWTLALSGHLKFAHVYFTKPHYNSGLVVSASFSNELEE